MKNKKTVQIIFWVGLVLLLALSAYLGYEIAETTEMQSVLRDGWEVPITTYNVPLGIVSGLGIFLVLGAIWGFVCKLILKKLDSKNNDKENKD